MFDIVGQRSTEHGKPTVHLYVLDTLANWNRLCPFWPVITNHSAQAPESAYPCEDGGIEPGAQK